MEIEEILVAIQKAADTIATPNCAAWLSAIAALGTVVVAIMVAIMQYVIYKKQNKIAEEQTQISKNQAEISDKQNKIALFEKRFLVFSEISKVISMGQAIKTNPRVTLKYIYRAEMADFGYNLVIDTADPESTITNFAAINRTLACIKQAFFLFPEIEKEDVNKLCKKFYNFFFELLIEALHNPDMMNEQFESTSKFDFITVSEEFKAKYFAHIVQNLHLAR